MSDTAIKERPIRLKAVEVRSILDRRKTQLRRVVQPQPRYGVVGSGTSGSVLAKNAYSSHPNVPPGEWINCHYAGPGDRLWVQEKWYHGYLWDGDEPLAEGKKRTYYAADRNGPEVVYDEYGEVIYNKDGSTKSPWCLGVCMPRSMSRLTLEVTGVRVERLREISEEDIEAEGVRVGPMYFGVGSDGLPVENEPRDCDPWCCFADQWNSINTKPGHTWDDKPWVWVISFERKDTPNA